MAVATIAALAIWWFRPGLPLDRELAMEVPVVLQIKITSQIVARDYQCANSDVLQVLKNSTDTKFPKKLVIGLPRLDCQIPLNTCCTVYLVPHNKPYLTPEGKSIHAYRWKLYEDNESTPHFTHPSE